MKTIDGVATFGDNKVSYFKDPEGNVRSLAQRGRARGRRSAR